ncbi:hypothetical protein BKA25_004488 [Actinoalloteichus hymeniacidonis]|uniref:Uncharacterized protein n=1 Tax=Actinoalloteichus hymeniacidonis TaxID=340345 RepID=A0AAC9HMF5_9PSEU|nr:hypothetical protein TL08_04895 [Actinoalloteichus hymeniacidonis]MBB5910172.1 hypothetical protein [Actinoalloteichus hymeniacidonis]
MNNLPEIDVRHRNLPGSDTVTYVSDALAHARIQAFEDEVRRCRLSARLRSRSWWRWLSRHASNRAALVESTLNAS